ncbi:hypothetical protein EW146_g1371 [Bondarzewia mesenterica]|uniref:Uncharacterized protein n=1 Tax=Bondarzewia mesenterica TaxID=1095465 RepID=A0A4S4MA54_9AGAM|nr:hypothetical protein EW146_g1371 [Bondarzewia mesenterica]
MPSPPLPNTKLHPTQNFLSSSSPSPFSSNSTVTSAVAPTLTTTSTMCCPVATCSSSVDDVDDEAVAMALRPPLPPCKPSHLPGTAKDAATNMLHPPDAEHTYSPHLAMLSIGDPAHCIHGHASTSSVGSFHSLSLSSDGSTDHSADTPGSLSQFVQTFSMDRDWPDADSLDESFENVMVGSDVRPIDSADISHTLSRSPLPMHLQYRSYIVCISSEGAELIGKGRPLSRLLDDVRRDSCNALAVGHEMVSENCGLTSHGRRWETGKQMRKQRKRRADEEECTTSRSSSFEVQLVLTYR